LQRGRRFAYTRSVVGETIVTAADSVLATWARRCVTIPTYCGLSVLAVCGFPLFAGVGALVDVVRRTPWVMLRCVTFITFYLCCEIIGIAAAAAVWLANLGGGAGCHARFMRWNFSVQCWWARTLLSGARHIFGLRIAVEPSDPVAPGPIILFIRHASLGDTLLPAVLISDPHGIVLRYVLKRELLWDPCLDIVGHRLPNYFVRRGSGDSAGEIAAIQGLMRDLGAHDGVLIYPEGTRFTPAKRARILARSTASGDARLYEWAGTLTHVLPPRLGGPLALLAADAGADAVFCAHTGFEDTATVRDLFRGALVGRAIRVGFWRIPFAEIPRDAAARTEWLYAQWRRMDDWVGRMRAPHAPGIAAQKSAL